MTFGLGYNWTDAKNHSFTFVKIEPRPTITILPRLKIELRPYTKLGIRNVNAIFFIFYNATVTFSLLWTRHQLSTVVVIQPPFTLSATVKPPSILLRSFVFHSSRWFILRSYHATTAPAFPLGTAPASSPASVAPPFLPKQSFSIVC